MPHEEIIHPAYGFRYDLETMFQNETVGGKPNIVLTAYMVDPGN